MTKKTRPPDEELLKLSHEDFVLWFLSYNKVVVLRYINRRLIPNRYDCNDVIAYMSERMLDILKKREAKGKAIKNPRIYFSKLIDFWCIEYQRMHGYIYGMPKRPRNIEAEEEISKYGFVYLETENSSKTANGFLENPQLAYIDVNLNSLDTEENLSTMGYNLKGQNPDVESEPWNEMMKMVLPEDRPVLNCLFKMNMSIPETSKYLGIAVSTAYTRRDRGLAAVSGNLVSGLDVDRKSWKVLEDVTSLRPSSIDITDLFS